MALPDKFISQLHDLGLDDLPEALMSTPAVTSVRFNPAKGAPEWPGGECVPWAKGAFYLPERPRFTLDPRLHQGRYYVQEASSMFHSWVISHLVDGVTSPLRVLDSCAAPGGKTLAMADALPEGSLTVANEYVPARAAVLRENVVKWGNPSMIVTRADTADLARARSRFDIILADVPCSGEGMMRKEAEAVEQWSPALVRECVERQEEILDNLWPLVAPGGYLVYSTCTFNRLENEAMVERMISLYGAESVEIPVDPEWGITPGIETDAHCMRFIPGRTRGEGLFVSVLRKPGDRFGRSEAPALKEKSKGKGKQKPQPIPKDVEKWIAQESEYKVFVDDDRVTAFPSSHLGVLSDLKKCVDVIHEGVTLATLKGKDTIPAHSLAMSTLLAPDAFPRVELSRDEALTYLRGEIPPLPLSSSTPRGYILLTHGDSPLGFIKNIGNRANSLYPAAWRIRMNIKD